MAKKAIAKTTDESVPSYLQGKSFDHQKDNFGMDDVAVPQVKLLQGTSEQITSFDEANVGHFWHTGADIDLGKELEFVICSRVRKYLLQAPLDDGQGILARAEDAKTWDRKGEWTVQVDKKTKATWKIDDLDVMKSGLTEWGTYDPEDENSPPAATLFYNYLVLLPQHMELGPVVISLARSAIKNAKRGLNDKIEFQKGNNRPMQSLKFIASAVDDTSPAGNFNNWKFRMGGYVDEELFNQATSIGETMKLFQVKDEGSYDPPETSDDDDDEDY